MFGPKDPVQTGPFCSRAMVVIGRAECRPCSRRRCRRRQCMLSIDIDQVHQAALQVLDGGGRCRAEQDGVSELVQNPKIT
jgi:ADP-heptose:LPS heptosyltransferase